MPAKERNKTGKTKNTRMAAESVHTLVNNPMFLICFNVCFSKWQSKKQSVGKKQKTNQR